MSTSHRRGMCVGTSGSKLQIDIYVSDGHNVHKALLHLQFLHLILRPTIHNKT